ncbi:MAG: GNAT family N-acetyltransferase [Desulfobacterales bacterium]
MHSIKYFLQTERLGFRKWREDDLDLAVGLWGDFEVTKLFDSRGELSKEQIQKRLFQEIVTEQKQRIQYWPIFLLENGNHVGACGLRPYNIKNNIFEIGFHICSSQWGKGYATEAARRVMKYAFKNLKISGLFAGHNPKNEASRQLLIKLGFRYTHDEYYEPTGLKHPSYLLTVEDYTT